MKLTGGYTNYGQDIGILMLDTIFPRIPGDIGNALSYPFPVRYKVVKDAFCERIMGDQVDEELLAPFIKAAQELEAEGCNITSFENRQELVDLFTPYWSKNAEAGGYTELLNQTLELIAG